MSDLRALDTYAGTGWSVACQRLGIPEAGVELMPEARRSRAAAGMSTVHDDVWTFPTNPHFERILGGANLHISSPSCVAFSAAGKGAGRRALDQVLAAVADKTYVSLPALAAFGRATDPRIAMVLTPLHFALRPEAAPEFVTWEQVPSVLPVWQACAVVLRDAGFSVWAGVLHSEQHGVPQTRKRAYLIARRDGLEAAPPVPTHSRYHARTPERLDPGVLPWVSMADALSVAEPGWEPTPAVPGDVSWVHRRPSPTVVGSFAPDVVAAPGYRKPGDPPRQKTPGSVLITLEQAALLQGYPPGFVFAGSRGKQFLQVGNAVPPPLAFAVLSTFL